MEYSVRKRVSKVRFILAEEDSVRREGSQPSLLVA